MSPAAPASVVDMILDFNDIGFISELVDEIALEKPLDWEAFSPSLKEIAINESVEHLLSIINNPEMSEREKGLSIAAIFSYLTLENTILWVENRKHITGT